MKEVCNVGRWKVEEQIASPSIPHEIIVDILSRLPVKDLLRFRVVCKQWEATISDPGFAENHLQQRYKNPSSQKLIAWEDKYNNNGLHVVELRNNCIEYVSAIEFGLGCYSDTLCSCDGLYLKYFPDVEGPPYKCVLWNPSRRTYRELYCPVPIDGTRPIQGMYYDSLMKDYKIVIADMEHYAVYSCRDNKWGDTKEMKRFLGDFCPYDSVFVNGSIYWMVMDYGNDEYTGVICFDCKDESFNRLAMLNCDDKIIYLTSFGGQLCLLVNGNMSCCRIEIMKKLVAVMNGLSLRRSVYADTDQNTYSYLSPSVK